VTDFLAHSLKLASVPREISDVLLVSMEYLGIEQYSVKAADSSQKEEE
jgi:hypothetical protein